MKRMTVTLICLALGLGLLSLSTPLAWASAIPAQPASAIVAPQPADGLIAHWPFDEGTGNMAADASGKGHTGTLYGASWVNGKVGKALSFNGQNNYVRVEDAPDLSGMAQLTLEAWVYPRGQTRSWQKIIIKPSNALCNDKISYVFFWRENPYIGRDRYASTIQNELNADYSIELATTPSSLDNGWHHFAFTYDGATLHAYVDGVVDANSISASGSVRATTSPLFIGVGVGWCSVNEFFYGYLDEVKMYSRARTSNEIAIDAGVLIPATLDIDPDTINLKSNAKWITAYIELPAGSLAADIDLSTVRLQGTIPAVTDPKYGFATNSAEYLIDHDSDGILERLVKFDGQAVRDYIRAQGAPDSVTLTVTGKAAGTSFTGEDTVKVLK